MIRLNDNKLALLKNNEIVILNKSTKDIIATIKKKATRVSTNDKNMLLVKVLPGLMLDSTNQYAVMCDEKNISIVDFQKLRIGSFK